MMPMVGTPGTAMPTLSPDVTVRYQQGEAVLTVRRAYCKGCNLCVDACPAKILRLDAVDRIIVSDIARCLFCGICAGRCPDFVFVLDRAGGKE